jgi:hypothetical protein
MPLLFDQSPAVNVAQLGEDRERLPAGDVADGAPGVVLIRDSVVLRHATAGRRDAARASSTSAATPEAAGANTCRRQQVLIQSKENLGTYCSCDPFLLWMHTRTILGH